MKKIIIAISLLIILTGGYFAASAIFGSKESEYQLVEAVKGTVTDLVAVSGTVISAKEIDLQFESSGRIREVVVQVGDQVDEGQLLVSLNISELSAQLQSSQAALEISEARLAKTIAGSQPEEIQIYQTAVDKAELELDNKEQTLNDVQTDAQNDLEDAYEDALDAVQTAYTVADQALIILKALRQEYFAGGGSQLALNVRDRENVAENDLSLAEEDPTLDKTKTALQSIRDALAYIRAAFDDPSISNDVSATDETTVDTERSSIDNQIVNLTSAEQTIKSTKITNQSNLNEAEANYQEAKAALTKAEDELALKKAEPRQEDIDLAQAEVRQAQAKVNEIRAKINKAILRAPTAGVITALEKEEGETASANTTIISMIGQGKYQIEANVSETEIAKVELADPVLMTLDALGPQEEFSGHIIKINPAETVVSGVIYYKVTSVFEAEDERIKSGMTVNLDIQTDQKENVLYLPYYVIQEVNGDRYVEIFQDGQVEKRDIQIGLEGENRVEILSGLSVGDQVIFSQD